VDVVALLPWLGLVLAAGGYLAFALLLTTSRLPTPASRLLLLAVLVNTLWLGLTAWQQQQPEGLIPLYLVGLETFKDAAWLAFLCFLVGRNNMWVRWLPVLVFGCLHYIPGSLFYLSALVGSSAILMGHLLLKVMILVQLEQLYRQTRSELRWAIKPLVLGLGAAYVFELVFYAESLLVTQLDGALNALTGYVYLLALPCILLATKRTTQWSVRIFVSRGVVFHSTMMFAVGGYLLLMALAGYYLSFLGAIWGGFLQQLFYLFALFLLAALLFTEQYRRRLKVFITKHFFANKYEYREEWLALNRELSKADTGQVFEQALALMLEKSGFRQGYLLWRGEQSEFVLRASLAPFHLQVEELVRAAEPFWRERQWLIDLVDYRNNPQQYPGLVLPVDYPASWQLLVPLVHRERVSGAFMLISHPEYHMPDWEERDFLNTVCQQLALFVAFAEASSALAVAKQFEAFNQMSAFLVHDLKNTLAQLNLIRINALKYRDNPEFVQDTFETVENVAQRLERMLGQLRSKQHQQQQVRNDQVAVGPLLQRVCKRQSGRRPQPWVETDINDKLNVDAEQLENALCHLVQNAQEATDETGWVKLSSYRRADQLVIEVADNGQGMDNGFIRDKLFTPFQTTKGNAGMGIGVYEAKRFIEQVGGQLNVESRVGEGTRFYLCFARQTGLQ